MPVATHSPRPHPSWGTGALLEGWDTLRNTPAMVKHGLHRVVSSHSHTALGLSKVLIHLKPGRCGGRTAARRGVRYQLYY